jgi:hypothetical protein
MSGKKQTYVSVEERELRRLREQDSRLRTLSQDLPERLNAVRRQAQNEMMGRIRPLEARQESQDRKIQTLKSDLAGLERDTRKRLKQQQKDFTSRLEDQRGEYLSLIADQDRRLTGMIQSEQEARQAAVDHLQTQISAIVADADRREAASRAVVADLKTVADTVAELPHDRFAPGRFESINRHVADAQRNLDAGMSEAALSTAQRAYWELADLRAEVLAKEQELILLHQAAIESARAILEEARSHRQYRLEIGEGSDRDAIDLEVDHWTHGALSEFETEVERVNARLDAEAETLTADEVRELIGELDAHKARLPEIVETARQNILASQLRVNIADLAVEAFKAQGYAVADETYEGEDERNAYVVKLTNVAGSEVVTVISPVPDQFGQNEVTVHSYDQTFVDETTLRQRAEELVSALNAEGLQAAPPQHVGDAEPEFQDLKTVRDRKATRDKTTTRK